MMDTSILLCLSTSSPNFTLRARTKRTTSGEGLKDTSYKPETRKKGNEKIEKATINSNVSQRIALCLCKPFRFDSELFSRRVFIFLFCVSFCVLLVLIVAYVNTYCCCRVSIVSCCTCSVLVVFCSRSSSRCFGCGCCCCR